MIIGAKLKGPDAPPPAEEDPLPKLRVRLPSLVALDLEPTEDMVNGELVAIASARRQEGRVAAEERMARGSI